MIITIDTGGTKTLIETFDEAGAKSIITKFPTPRDTSEYIAALRNTLSSILDQQSVEAISIAVPGVVHNGIAVICRNLGWEDFDIISQLYDALGGRVSIDNILLENDAQLACIGETRLLDNTPNLSIYVTASTGVGTGISINGKMIPGLQRFEGGQVFVEYHGEIQRWETIASGKTFYEMHGRFGSDINESEESIWQDFADRLSRGLMILLPTYMPDTLIIGGSMGTHYPKYARQLETILRQNIPSYLDRTKLVQAQNPEEAVIYGCYYHAIDSIAR